MIARLQWHGTMLRSDGVRNHRTCPDCRNPHTWRRRMEDRKPVRNACSSGSCLAAFGLPTSLAWHGYLSSGCPFGRAGKEPRRVPSPLNEVAREPRASSDGRRSWFGQCPRPGGPHANAERASFAPAVRGFTSPVLNRKMLPVLLLRQSRRCTEVRLKTRRGNQRSTR